jgi:Ca-activated chloride channel homolog
MFELAWPWVWLALPAPFLIWFLVPKATSSIQAALKVPFFNEIEQVVDNNQRSLTGHQSVRFILIIWLLMLFALSGPRWVGEPQPVEREGYNIMLALDLSGSMELNDMLVHGQPVSRLSIVKRAAEQFVKERHGDKMGLILFGSRAYLQTPLTYDRQNLLMRIDDATVGLAGKTTSIGDALGLAVKRLQAAPAKGKVIILLTDGANNSGILAPDKAAELAKLDDIKVYTIGLGSKVDPRALNSMLFSMNASADLDEETLKKVADMTGGSYFRATDLKSLEQVYSRINQLEHVSQEQQTIRPQHDYYPWPLGFALILLFYWMAHFGGLFFVKNTQKEAVS